MDDIIYLRRKSDGQIIDIPARHLDQTLKQGFELVDTYQSVYKDSSVNFERQINDKECPICGDISDNVEEHKKTHV